MSSPWRFSGFILATKDARPGGRQPLAPAEGQRLVASLLSRTGGQDGLLGEIVRALGSRSGMGLGATGAASVRDRVLAAVEAGELGVFTDMPAGEGSGSSGGLLPVQEAAVRAPSQTPEPVREDDTYVHLTIVDDATGQPLPNLQLTLAVHPEKGGASTVHKVCSDAEGIVQLAGVKPGTCQLKTEVPPGLTLAEILHVSGFGLSTLGPSISLGHAAVLEAAEAPRTLARLTFHQVRTGETLASVAFFYGVSVKQLCELNFGTSDTGEVKELLPAVVGCIHQEDDGTYVFDDTDRPGYLAIPRTERQKPATFPTGKREVMRMRSYVDEPYRVRLIDPAGQPIAAVLATVRVGEARLRVKSDGDGWIAFSVGTACPERAELTWEKSGVVHRHTVKLHCGDDVEDAQVLGWRRLWNLGYMNHERDLEGGLTRFCLDLDLDTESGEAGSGAIPSPLLQQITTQWERLHG